LYSYYGRFNPLCVPSAHADTQTELASAEIMSSNSFPVTVVDGGVFYATVDLLPSECPRCHAHVDALHRGALTTMAFPATVVRVQVILQCTRRECRELFIASYSVTLQVPYPAPPLALDGFKLTGVAPLLPKPVVFPTEITALSPKFVEIFNEAAAAEAAGLLEIAGPGYGKALEFLVKDYLIEAHPAAAEDIKKELLGHTIESRVEDSRVKASAKRAAWLRNDETHYQRRHPDKELAHLKTLISLTVNWIHSSMLTDAIVDDMPETPTRVHRSG
jgi:hypothetical protein